jgi:PAS domain S-box-containing protein
VPSTPSLNANLDDLVAASPAMIYTADCVPPYRVRFVTPNVTEQLGYEPAAFVADAEFWLSRVHPDDRPVVAASMSRAEACGTLTCEYRFRHADGTWRWMRYQATLVRDAQGLPVEMVGHWFDITAHREALTALAESEARYRALVEAAPDAIVLHAQGRISYANASAVRLFGAPDADTLCRFDVRELLDPADRDRAWGDITSIEGGAPGTATGEFRIRRVDGERRCVDVEITRAAFVHAGARAVQTILRDVSDRKQAQQALRDRDQYFRRLIEHASDIITVVDGDGQITYESPAIERVAGYAPRVGHNAFELVHPDDLGRVRSLFDHGMRGAARSVRTPFRLRHRDGRWLHLEAVGSVLMDGDRAVGAIVNSRDVTDRLRAEEERKVLEAQLRQAQKMEAIGRLAGGVAHDFNNLLTSILGFSELVEERLPEGDPLRGEIAEVRRAGQSAASLTRHLLAFSRRQLLDPEVLELREVVTDLSRLLRRTLGEDIGLEIRLGDAPVRTRADRAQIEQVLMNLAVNSRDAMPTGGSLAIEVDVERLRAPHTSLRWTIPPGTYAVLRVVDTGSGISAEALEHLFEPFYTTKESGRGTGLGLATVYGIVTQSGGYIGVDTVAGHGTTIAVYLLLATGAADERAAGAPQPVRRGTETILIVEDDTMVRQLASEVLSRRGYRVLAVGSAEAAGPILAYEHVDLVLADVVLPGASGAALARQIQGHWSGCRTLLMSGYADESLRLHGVDTDRCRFLQKPFTPKTLLQAVAGVLA